MDSADPIKFVQTVKPLLAANDLAALCMALRTNWTDRQILRLLRGPHADARKIAALALGLLGQTHCIDALVEQLADTDAMVNQMAEHALWTIWFRAGKPFAHRELIRGVRDVNAGQYGSAEAHFDHAIKLDPDFAEAYNQRAIVRFLCDSFDASADDCRNTIDRMPCHFGAWAGLGHCHANASRFDDAIACYEQATAINPYLVALRQSIADLKLVVH